MNHSVEKSIIEGIVLRTLYTPESMDEFEGARVELHNVLAQNGFESQGYTVVKSEQHLEYAHPSGAIALVAYPDFEAGHEPNYLSMGVRIWDGDTRPNDALNVSKAEEWDFGDWVMAQAEDALYNPVPDYDPELVMKKVGAPFGNKNAAGHGKGGATSTPGNHSAVAVRASVLAKQATAKATSPKGHADAAEAHKLAATTHRTAHAVANAQGKDAIASAHNAAARGHDTQADIHSRRVSKAEEVPLWDDQTVVFLGDEFDAKEIVFKETETPQLAYVLKFNQDHDDMGRFTFHGKGVSRSGGHDVQHSNTSHPGTIGSLNRAASAHKTREGKAAHETHRDMQTKMKDIAKDGSATSRTVANSLMMVKTGLRGANKQKSVTTITKVTEGRGNMSRDDYKHGESSHPAEHAASIVSAIKNGTKTLKIFQSHGLDTNAHQPHREIHQNVSKKAFSNVKKLQASLEAHGLKDATITRTADGYNVSHAMENGKRGSVTGKAQQSRIVAFRRSMNPEHVSTTHYAGVSTTYNKRAQKAFMDQFSSKNPDHPLTKEYNDHKATADASRAAARKARKAPGKDAAKPATTTASKLDGWKRAFSSMFV